MGERSTYHGWFLDYDTKKKKKWKIWKSWPCLHNSKHSNQSYEENDAICNKGKKKKMKARAESCSQFVTILVILWASFYSSFSRYLGLCFLKSDGQSARFPCWQRKNATLFEWAPSKTPAQQSSRWLLNRYRVNMRSVIDAPPPEMNKVSVYYKKVSLRWVSFEICCVR